jgi:hypothetical protein
MERTGWDSLPAELQLQVLVLLPGETLPALRLVARRWRDLADDPSLRGRFHLVVDAGTSPEEIRKLVARNPCLMTVTMQDHQLSKALLMAMVFHPRLDTPANSSGSAHYSWLSEPLHSGFFLQGESSTALLL